MIRHPMTPAEFDAALRALVSECPWLSETSGRRTRERNAAVGGKPGSKHVLGMAQDFVADDVEALRQAAPVAVRLGLWILLHDVGSGTHLHVQGLPPGDVPEWWRVKYGRLGGPALPDNETT